MSFLSKTRNKFRGITDTNLLTSITIVVFVVMYLCAVIFLGEGFLKAQTFFNMLNANAALIILSCGMSLVMTDIGGAVGIDDPMIPGIVIGVVGMLMAIINYPIYKGILGSRRKKYADKIIALSDKIMNK